MGATIDQVTGVAEKLGIIDNDTRKAATFIGTEAAAAGSGVVGGAAKGHIGAANPQTNKPTHSVVPNRASIPSATLNSVLPSNSVFSVYPLKTQLNLKSVDEQAAFLSHNISGLSKEQALIILNQGHKRGSSVVFGGSRVRGNNDLNSDLDVGFGGLTSSQASKVIRSIDRKNPTLLILLS